MLLDIREKSQSWIAWVVVVLITIPFALWGISSYFEGASEVIVAKVNDSKINFQQYQREMSDHRRRLRQLLGNSFKPEMTENPQVRLAVLDNMIETNLINQYISQAGFATSDENIIKQIGQIPQFQKDGIFDKRLYRQVVSSQGMSLSQFEASVGRDLILNQFRVSFADAAFILPYEMDEYAKLTSQKREAKTMAIDESMIQINQEVTETEIAVEFEKNKLDYFVPEAVKIAYVELTIDEIAKDITVDEKALQDLYDQTEQTIKTKEQRRLSHIMLVGSSEDDYEKNLPRINEIKDKIQNGKAFDKVAADFSEDPGSAAKGGDLGFYGHSGLDPQIEAVLFKLKLNEVSTPIKSKFGYHLIKLTDIKHQTVDSFEDAKAQILVEEKIRQAQEIYFEKAELMANLAYEQPDSLDSIIEQLDLKVKDSDWISVDYAKEDVLSNPKVKTAMFSDMVLKDRQNSDVLELNDAHMLVLNLNEHRDKQYKKLNEVTDEIKQFIIQTKQSNALKVKAQELIKALNAGSDADKIATEVGVTWSSSEEFSRSNTALNTKIFSMRIPQNNALTYDFVKIDNKQILISLSKVSSQTDDQTKKNLAEQLKQQIQNYSYADFLKQLHLEADVQTYPEHILDN